jgi:hypothetical protein
MAAVCVGCGAQPEPAPASTDIDPDEPFLSAGGKEDSLFTIEEGSVEAEGVLRLVNTADMATLDDSDQVGLDVRAASHIVSYRDQDPTDPNDDETIDTLVELDAIPWVGKRAFGKLYEYAEANGYFTVVDEPDEAPAEYPEIPGEQEELEDPKELEDPEDPEDPLEDIDGDGVADAEDNCIGLPNADQADADDDGRGDVCAPGTGNGPYAGLIDADLERVLRDANAGHITYTYADARDHMFGTIDNVEGLVECVYTGRTIETSDRTDAYNKGFNTEHTWPKSRGAEFEPAKSDLHHLFPTTIESNGVRSSFFFGDVTGSISWTESGSELGQDTLGNKRFEPRDVHKGDIARAMFYFAVAYGHDIPAFEEDILRQWHTADPVDDDERARHEAVAAFQNSRNPFIDRAERADRISDL